MIKILVGDVMERLRELDDETFHCVVTSPPYWGLRDYGTASWEGGDPNCDHVELYYSDLGAKSTLCGGNVTRENQWFHAQQKQYREFCRKCGARRVDRQIGLEKTPGEHVERMVEIFREVRRVMRKDGTLWLNYGSLYASSSMQPSQPPHDLNGLACDSDNRERRDSLDVGHACPCCGDVSQGASRTRRVRNSHTSRQPEQCEPQLEETIRDTERSGSSPFAVDASSPDAPQSTSVSSSPHALDACDHEARVSASPSGVQTSTCDASPSVRKSDGTDDTSRSGGLLAFRSLGMELFCKACGYSTNRPFTFKAKDLIPMPWIVALALQADGWWLRSDIIWAKPNPLPEPVTDRPTTSHEYMFLMTRAPRYFYDADAVREPSCDPPGTHRGGALVRTAKGGGKDPTGKVAWEHHGGGMDSLLSTGSRNLRTVLEIATAPFPGAHFATFPPKLPEIAIKAGTSEKGCCPECGAPWRRVVEAKGGAIGKAWHELLGEERLQQGQKLYVPKDAEPYRRETKGWEPGCECGAAETVPCRVLDPFGGAGTTGLVADRLGRDCTLIELNPEYAEMAAKRLRADCPMFTKVMLEK